MENVWTIRIFEDMYNIHDVQFCIENYQELCTEFYGEKFYLLRRIKLYLISKRPLLSFVAPNYTNTT